MIYKIYDEIRYCGEGINLQLNFGQRDTIGLFNGQYIYATKLSSRLPLCGEYQRRQLNDIPPNHEYHVGWVEREYRTFLKTQLPLFTLLFHVLY
jgi:hypothetical protein